MKWFKHIALVLALVFKLTLANAQNMQTEMADKFRADGKIYVVIAVMAIVFAGIAIYLFYIDRKVGRLEKALKESEKK
ncbi:MAG: CcmD family protein [Flavobacteriales bacterium]